MIEPPRPGFTGVVWNAREPERLTRELSTGPGAIPMAEAGVAWTKLAAAFGTAVLEYQQIVAALGTAWDSDTSRAVLDKISLLREWLTEAAKAAAENALRAEKQAAAYQLARLTMPNSVDIAAIQEAQRALERISAMLGAPIRAVAAHTDAEDDLAKAAAARVMQSYEASTEPLATPWPHEQPPTIAPGDALAAEQATAQAAESTQSALTAGMPGVAMPGMLGPVAFVRPLGSYRPQMVAQSVETTETIVPQPVTTATAATAAAGTPFAPVGALGSAAGATQDEEYQTRAAVVEMDTFGQELGVVSAPAVLGAPEPAAPSGPVAAGGGS
ncbi:PPE domain-containing protein [Nocardia sp. NPDC052566]|uniref:PPE domain-containing protein n=1 Tax=Nocardia sp. NPDC052566 TaxID=3364330 RepID=UPI0037C7F8AC